MQCFQQTCFFLRGVLNDLRPDIEKILRYKIFFNILRHKLLDIFLQSNCISGRSPGKKFLQYIKTLLIIEFDRLAVKHLLYRRTGSERHSCGDSAGGIDRGTGTTPTMPILLNACKK